LAATTPFALRSNYPTDFVGRYQALSSSVSATDLTLSAAIRLTEHLSIGGGPVIDYLQTRLTDAVNAGPGPLTDLQDEIKGDSVSLGYNLGLLYAFDDRTRMGLDYHSRIPHTLGVGNALSAPQPFTALLPYNRINSTTQVTLPDSVTLAVYHELSPRWALLSEVQWNHWSLFNNVTIAPGIGPGGAPTIVAENFRNTWFGSIGANWRVTDSLMLQAGVGYDQSPVTDANRTLRLPDADRIVLGAGLTYELTAGTRVMVGYGHQFLAGPSVRDSAGGVGVTAGRYQEDSNSYSGGLSVRF
jgi:long-chain fatty acid transport protein